MIDSLNSLGGVSTQPTLRVVASNPVVQPDAGASQGDPTANAAGATPAAAAPAAAAPAATRIMVDRSQTGVYVYRLVDVATGRTLAELPRSQSDKLTLTSDYAPGALAETSA